jgi:hypothetical protein
MTRKLRVADDLALPLDFITMATVVYGARGAGKTNFGAVVAEELTKVRQRFCIIDLKGDFYGLKSTADGRKAAIPIVVFGGDHADLPLEPDAGEFLGELVASMEQSVVLDFEKFSKGKQVRFLSQFFAALYDKNREPLLVIADEAQRYAPQKPASPDANVCLGAVEDLVKLGRKHGIGVLLITQRGAGLNKEVSEICDMVIAFRTPGALDQTRIRGWLEANFPKKEHDEFIEQLASLQKGDAVFASAHPDLNIYQTLHVRLRETFDSSATPKIGQRRREPKVLAESDLVAIKEKMSAAIARAEAEDPRKLRDKVRQLESEIAKLKKQHEAAQNKVATKEKRVEVPVLDKEDLARLEKAIGRLDDVRDHAAQAQQAVVSTLGVLKDEIVKYRTGERHFRDVSPILQRGAADDANWRVAELRQAPKNGTHASADKLGGRPLQMLGVLAQRNAVGTTRNQLATLVGLSPRTGTFATYMSQLNVAGLIERRGELFYASPLGVSRAGHVPPLPTGPELLELWCSKLNGRAKDMLRALVDQPGGYSRDELAQAVGLSANTGTYATYLSQLNSNELIEKSRGLFVVKPEFLE